MSTKSKENSVPNMSGIEAIKALLPASNYLEDAEDKAPYETPWRVRAKGIAALVCFPDSTEQLSRLMALCYEYQIPVVPQGGNTGLVGGSTPDDTGDEIIINLSRMKNIRELDTLNYTVTVEAGCILATLKETLEAKDLLFPLSMASEGSAEVGGFIATNAGGTAVLRYGNTRDLVLGVEAVLPDGTILNALSGLRKDNTGYDLKQLLIGSEGTLGIITAATLKLFPQAVATETAMLALPSIEAVLSLFQSCRSQAYEVLTAFELIPALGLDLVETHIEGAKRPFAEHTDWAVLIEYSTSSAHIPLRPMLESFLEEAFTEGLVTDGVLAESKAQRESLWHLRENISEAEKCEGAMANFDVSVPISHTAIFIAEAIAACSAIVPDIRPVPFGHIGDGNIHFNLLQPKNMEKDVFLSHKAALERATYRVIKTINGSISAEHGIGKERKPHLIDHACPTSLALMQTIKKAVDPRAILNPGRIFDV